jgi:glycosyltransferase involved in cell wall biosynthesis
MKILYVNNILPYPLQSGSKIRKYHLAAALSEENELWMLGAAPNGKDLDTYQKLNPKIKFIEIPYMLGQERIPIAKETRKITSVETFDIMHVSNFWQWPGEKAFDKALVVLDSDNVESILLRRMMELNGTKLSPHNVLAIESVEKHALKRADLVLACSKNDARLISDMVPDSMVEIIPNGVDLEFYRYHFNQKNVLNDRITLLYSGLFSYWPNTDASVYFASEILPIIRKKLPQVVFRMVGGYPTSEVMSLAEKKGVEVIPDVPDIRPYMSAADILVVPLRAGSGTRLKILEAFAIGLPVVTTPIGCEGLDVIAGDHLMIAEEPEEFAQQVITLVKSPEMRKRMGANGRKLVEEKYGWKAIGARLTQLYREMIVHGS